MQSSSGLRLGLSGFQYFLFFSMSYGLEERYLHERMSFVTLHVHSLVTLIVSYSLTRLANFWFNFDCTFLFVAFAFLHEAKGSLLCWVLLKKM